MTVFRKPSCLAQHPDLWGPGSVHPTSAREPQAKQPWNSGSTYCLRAADRLTQQCKGGSFLQENTWSCTLASAPDLVTKYCGSGWMSTPAPLPQTQALGVPALSHPKCICFYHKTHSEYWPCRPRVRSWGVGFTQLAYFSSTWGAILMVS